MSKNTFIIERLYRVTDQGRHEELVFRSGVNVIVGEPNTGKTKWLQMLDYLLGDPGRPEDAFGEELTKKYCSVGARLLLGETEMRVERRWKELGSRTKVFVMSDAGEEALTDKEFQQLLLSLLEIPIIHFPQGNPYSFRTWPELSFRNLFRHMYRQQRFWSDLADQQPPADQHTCLLQFIGAAQSLYPPEFVLLVEKRKKLMLLSEEKEHFIALLQEISRDLLSDSSMSVALTGEQIALAVTRAQAELDDMRLSMESLTAEAMKTLSTNGDLAESLTKQVVELRQGREKELARLSTILDRINELEEFKRASAHEAERLERALAAGDLLSPLRVEVCPNCDQAIPRDPAANPGVCYVCLQHITPTSNVGQRASARLNYELDQLRSDLSEADQLLRELLTQRIESERRIGESGQELISLEERLRPYKSASVIAPEIAELNIQIGQVQQKLQQLESICEVFNSRSLVDSKIDEIQAEISALELEVAVTASFPFQMRSSQITDFLNAYLNKLNLRKHKAWTKEPVFFTITDKKLQVLVGSSDWHQALGGTLTLYFLLAYHYALLRLGFDNHCNYPRLVILDLIAEVEGSSVADKENFILEPFVSIDGDSFQVIATGSAFDGLEDVHRIELHQVW